MQIADIASKIVGMRKVPITLSDSKTFSCVTYLKPGSDIERGLYLPNCDSLDALEYCKLNMPDGFRRIKEMICTKCDFDDISFSAFSILHELAHWMQYKNFIDKGHTDEEFRNCYESQRINLHFKRIVECRACRSKEAIIDLNTRYDKLYAELPTEKYANDFALNHLLKYVMMIK